MRNHVQGVGLLVVLAVAVWGTARLAAPAVGDTFGDDDSTASTTEDIIELSAGADETPMTPEEVFGLQWYLTLEGYDTRGVDGLMGSGTRSAIAEAKADYELTTISDRELFDFLVARYEDPEESDADETELEAGDDPELPLTDDTTPAEAADVG